MSKEFLTSISLLRELKQELYVIARSAELGDNVSIEQIQLSAEQSIKIIDGLILADSIKNGQIQLQLQPIGIGSVMHEVSYDVRSSINKPVSLEILANKSVDTNLSLVKSLLFSLSIFTNSIEHSEIIFKSFESKPDKVNIGIFSKRLQITQSDLDNGMKRIDKSDMPIPKYSSSAGASLLVAKKISDILDTNLSVKKHRNTRGFTVELPVTKQLGLPV